MRGQLGDEDSDTGQSLPVLRRARPQPLSSFPVSWDTPTLNQACEGGREGERERGREGGSREQQFTSGPFLAQEATN